MWAIFTATGTPRIPGAAASGKREIQAESLYMLGVPYRRAAGRVFEKEATFIKIGSTYSYLKRQEQVDKISSVTLPLGTFFHLDIHQEKRKIQDGDYIILLSDGITDCLMQENKEEEIRECISTMPWVRPAEIAGQIMNEVLQISKGKIRDDMTVLVMGFWENAYED